jgi:Flp pilus assembly protein TadD
MRIESDVTSRSRAGAVSQRDEGSGVARVLAERSGARRVTKASRELVAASVLTLALATFAPLTVADPTDIDPDLAARDADYAAGRKAAEQKDWPQAVQRFELALKRNPDHADLETDLGFAYRNLRQYDLAFRHYRRAIELDPRNRSAHEYIGEAYLMTGDLGSAEQHLKALQEICLLPCEELNDLQRAIAEYRKTKSLM